jgi:hypothetical protein
MVSVGVSEPGGPQPDRPVNLSLRAPAQIGWRKMEHKACIISHQGARSRGYKRRERARTRERAREREREGPTPLVFSRPFVVRLLVCARLSPVGVLDIPFYRCKEWPSCTMGV